MPRASKKKPCVFCGTPAPVTWNPDTVFKSWVSANRIIGSFRSKFDGVRDLLDWASVDETDTGCHPACALEAAIELCGFAERYPTRGLRKDNTVPQSFRIPEEMRP